MSPSATGNPHGEAGKQAESRPSARSGAEPFPPAASSHPGWHSIVVCLGLVLAVWIVFGQTRHFDFVNYDDNVYIYENPVVRQGFNLSGIVRAFTQANGAGEWVPLSVLTRMLDCQLYGLQPGGHHLTNVLLHAATGCLLFLVLRNMTGGFWPSTFVAALFAVHPLRVESVAWVTERKDVLSGLFFMLTLLAYRRAAHRQPGITYCSSVARTTLQVLDPRRWTFDYWLTLVFFTFGLLSKPMLVTVPFVLLLLDYWPLKRLGPSDSCASRSVFRSWAVLVLEKVPFLLLSAAACAITLVAQRSAIGSMQAFDYPTRVANALVSYVVYLRQMLYPAGLAPFYPYPQKGLLLWLVGISLMILLLITAGAVAGRRKHPYLLVGWLWYLGMLVPVIGLLQVGEQARADRYTYFPQIGLYILLTWGALDCCRTWRHRQVALGSMAAAILAVLLVFARVQTRYWKDSVSLWTHALACTSGNYLAQNNLGLALAGQGRTAEAIGHYEQALRIRPDYAKAHNNLGVALAAQGQFAKAIEHYTQALQLRPDDAQVHNNLGIALADEGRLTEAAEQYMRALQLKPDFAEAHNNLGLALAGEGRSSDAIVHYEQALRLKPDFAQAHYNLGNTLANQGRLAEAVNRYEQAIHFKPDYAEAHNNLGMALARQGRWPEAIEHYERTVQLRPNAAEPHYNLANALASEGRPADADAQFQQALTLATAQGNAALADAIRAKLKPDAHVLPQP